MTPMKAPTMLYRKGTQELIHKIHVDWIIVDAADVAAHLAQGWYCTPADVIEAQQAEETASAAVASKASKKAEQPQLIEKQS